MSGTASARWAPVTGIVSVALFLIGYALLWGVPDAGSTDEEIVSHFADSGNRAQEYVGLFLLALAVLFFLWFAGVLRDRLRAVEEEPKGISALALGSGVASASLLMAASSFVATIGGTIDDTDRFTLDPDTARLLLNASFMLTVGAIMFASVLVAATSVLALRTAVLPRWLGWVGLVVALAGILGGFLFFPLVAIGAWILVVGVFLITRAPREQEVRMPAD